MTSEILIMNPQAVALAADSAVTLVQERIRGDLRERKHKIFTSANKIFTLSKYHPVGIMIYNNATCMGTPWETINRVKTVFVLRSLSAVISGSSDGPSIPQLALMLSEVPSRFSSPFSSLCLVS